MNGKITTFFLTLLFLFCLTAGWSVVSDYAFTSTTGNAYVEITGGTIHGTSANDNEVFNDIPLGFDFNYNGTVYSSISIATNGFIAMGSSVATATLPISTGTTNNVIVPFARDIKSQDTGTLMSAVSGQAPNRVFTVQWHNYRRAPTSAANDTINFQIKLHETTNVITFHYGHMNIVTVATASTVQCGLRGASNTEFNNRMTTTDWTATVPGTANNSTCTINATVYPPLGLVFTWNPSQTGNPPLPAQIVSPANGATNVPVTVILHWLSGGGSPTGYKVYFGTNTPPSNIVNGTVITATSYDPDGELAYNTVYYWQIVPTNDSGDAPNCPVWSFTTLPDPTVSSFPYSQNWDSVTAPAVPPSWTVVNANNDNYTWTTTTTDVNSAPNALRCSYNSANATVAMDDWIISPPMQFSAGNYYRINFYYKAHNATYPEKVELKYGSANNISALTNQIFVNDNIINTSYTQGEAFIPVTQSGIYYFGFHGFSNPNMFYLYLDDITVTEVTPVFNPPRNLTATFTGTQVQLSWQAPLDVVPASYNIFRDNVQINSSPVTQLTYNDVNPPFGMHTYYVTALYTNPNGESVPSNSVSGELLVPVSNLQCSVSQHDVSLLWTPPVGPIYQDWIHYDNGLNHNAIGNGQAFNFDIAIRWTQTELAGILDRYITKVRFFPHVANCVYTVKVWTGGTSATNPGTLVETVPVPSPVIDSWNEVILSTPIHVPSSGELWVGVNCNTQTGFPAGCDNGPGVPGKGNLIYTDGWATLTDLNPELDFNWNLQAFATNYIGRDVILTQNTTTVTAEKPHPLPTKAILKSVRVDSDNRPINDNEEQRAFTGYRVWRDGEVIATINDVAVYNYTDTNLPNGSYVYEVTAVYTTGESAPCPFVIATVYVPIIPTIFEDSFEAYNDFATSFGNWILTDVDQNPTMQYDEFDFPGEGSPMAFAIFNPNTTVPPVTDAMAHTGVKMAVCPAAVPGPNNDWLISPRMRLGTENSVSFWAISTAPNGVLERIRVGISNADNPLPNTFAFLTGTNYVEPPDTNWTFYSYQIPTAYNANNVRIGIKCESVGGYALMIDDFKVEGNNGTGSEQNVQPITETALLGNYPNPFRASTSIAYNLKDDGNVTIEIYNVKGQLVKTLFQGKAKAGSYKLTWNGDDQNGKSVSPGIYFYKLKSGSYTSTNKMILMK